jgi:hypothetical protein
MRHPSPDVEQTMLEMVMISVAVESSSNGIMGNIQKWESRHGKDLAKNPTV